MISGKWSDEEKVIAQSMRDDNKGYTEIAKVLDCKKERVNSYCKVNGLGGYKGTNHFKDNNFNEFFKRFNNKYLGKFEYVNGYVNSESIVKIKCGTCNHVFERKAIGTIEKNTRCDYCRKAAQLNKENELKKQSRVRVLVRLIKAEIINRQREIDLVKECCDCRKSFKATSMGKTLCLDCRRKKKNRYKEIRNRKARVNGKVDYSISLDKLIVLEDNVCYLCGGQCDGSDSEITSEGHYIVGGSYPSIEHVKPLSKGGTHTWDNVKLAHCYCNTIKSSNEINVETSQMNLLMES